MFKPSQQKPMNTHPFQQQAPYHPYAAHQQPMQMKGFMQSKQGVPYQGPFQQQPNVQGSHPGFQAPKPSFLKSAFTNEHGSFDMNKTVNTVDQVVKTVHQVSPLVKQFSGFFLKK